MKQFRLSIATDNDMDKELIYCYYLSIRNKNDIELLVYENCLWLREREREREIPSRSCACCSIAWSRNFNSLFWLVRPAESLWKQIKGKIYNSSLAWNVYSIFDRAIQRRRLKKRSFPKQRLKPKTGFGPFSQFF